jgi:Crp-like helix-turn-helix domain
MQLWATLFLHLDRQTGEIMQSRDELADAVGTRPDDVSRIMTELETIGAISRKRVKVARMRGPGVVHCFMSPRVGTHLGGKARETAQQEAPLLHIMEGGRAADLDKLR